jgi:hypothetical protein
MGKGLREGVGGTPPRVGVLGEWPRERVKKGWGVPPRVGVIREQYLFPVSILAIPHLPGDPPMTFATQGPEVCPHQLEIRPLRSRHDVVHVHGGTPTPIRTLAPRFLKEDLAP